MSIGENLKQLREQRNMTQLELAERVGVTGPMICQIERGTKVPTLPLSLDIARALHCDIKELAGDTNE